MTRHLDAAEVEAAIDWRGAMDAIVHGHTLSTPVVDDTLLRRGNDSLLSRSAMVDGLGALVKTATVFPGNASKNMSSIHGSVSLFADDTGRLDATIDFDLLTRWKTAADSALAASRLARADSQNVLIVGAGAVAESMVDAYRSVLPDASFSLWNRSADRAAALARRRGLSHRLDLQDAVRSADVICTATMSTTPVVAGAWLVPGQHLDLIGGFRPDMRELDDDGIARATVFADSADTASDVGDVAGPVRNGVLRGADVVDFSGLGDGTFARRSDDEITVCKNAGGAHLDLMVARYMFDAVST
jgi:ornithine cyclodeaminase